MSSFLPGVSLLFLTTCYLVNRPLADEHEFRLYEDLMSDYNKLERPVSNNSQPVKVTLAVILQQIVDVVRRKVFSINSVQCILEDRAVATWRHSAFAVRSVKCA